MRRVLLPCLASIAAGGCQLATDFALEPVAETSEALCRDGRDSDFNGLTDCQDWSCLGVLACCDIPEILLEDDFDDGPSCQDPSCTEATCAELSCGPDATRWHAWPCPYPRVCDGALRLDKTECFAAGVLSRASMSLDPGLVVEIDFVGVPELRGYLEVALTRQDESDLPGHFAECGRQQRVMSFAAIRQVAAAGGWQAVAYFQEQEIGASAVVDGEHTVTLGIDDARRITFALDDQGFATGAIPVPTTEVDVRLALTGLTEQAAFGRVRIQAGLRCHASAGFSLVGSTLESALALAGDGEEPLSFDRDEVYHPSVSLAGGGVELYYTGCRWPPDRESCDPLSVAIGRATDGVRDPANPLLVIDDIPSGGESGIRTDMQVDLMGDSGQDGYFSPTSGTPIFRFAGGELVSLENVLPLGVAGTWDRSELCCATAAQHADGRTFLWYAGRASREENVWRIGLATSNDGVTFTRHPDNPVFAEGPPEAVDSGGVSNPVVIWDANRAIFRMWYEARDFFGDKRIGYAVSADGVRWSRSPDNPVLSPEEVGLATLGGPDVVLLPDGRLRMWVHGTTVQDLRRRIYQLVNEGSLHQ